MCSGSSATSPSALRFLSCEWLDPGTSALLLLVSQEVRPAVVKELGRYEGRVLYCTFPDPVRAELEAALGNGG